VESDAAPLSVRDLGYPRSAALRFVGRSADYHPAPPATGARQCAGAGIAVSPATTMFFL
jgi:hypothetical protein